MAREFFQCYHSYLQQMSSLSDAEFGRLIREALKYSSTGQSDPLPGKEDVAFPFVAFNIDREKQAYEEKCEKLKANGSKGTKAKGSKCKQLVAIGSNCKEDKEQDKEKEKNKEEYIRNSPSESKEKPHRKVDEVVSFFNEICVSFPGVRALSDKRKASITALLGKYSLEDIRTVFRKAEASSFLKGKDGKWSATFDWLISDTNFAKVLDGNFDDKTAPKKTETSTEESDEAFAMSWAIMENTLGGIS